MAANFGKLVYDVNFYLKAVELLLSLLGLIISDVQQNVLYENLFTHIMVAAAYLGFTIVTATIMVTYILEAEPPRKVTCLVFLGLGIPTYSGAGALLIREYFQHKDRLMSTNIWLAFSIVSFAIVLVQIIDFIYMLFTKRKVDVALVEIEGIE